MYVLIEWALDTDSNELPLASVKRTRIFPKRRYDGVRDPHHVTTDDVHVCAA